MKKTIKQECCNLDLELIEWLNRHLKAYLEHASKHIDLEFHTYTYNGKRFTQKQIIERLITITDILSETHFDFTKEYNNLKDEMYDLLKLVHNQMWW